MAVTLMSYTGGVTMRMRCSSCDTEVPFAAKCQACGRDMLPGLVEAPPAKAPQPKESKKARLRRAATFSKTRTPARRRSSPATDDLASKLAAKHERSIDSFPTVMAKLVIRDGSHFLDTNGERRPVEARSKLPLSALVAYLLPWAVADLQADVLLATPRPCRTLKEIERYLRTGELPQSNGHFGPRPPGDTTVERARDPLAQLDRISALQRTNTPASWAELANAWRVPALRGPIEAAMEQIGWSRFRILLDRVPGWPEGLDELVSRKLGEASERPRAKRTVFTYSHDDYWLADW